MIARLTLVLAAVSLPLSASYAVIDQETPAEISQPTLQNPLLEVDDAVERAEKKKILVMIEQAPNRSRPGSAYSSGYGSAQTKARRERLGRAIAKQYGFEFVELWPMPLIGLDCFIL